MAVTAVIRILCEANPSLGPLLLFVFVDRLVS